MRTQQYCVNHGTAIRILQTLREERISLAGHLHVSKSNLTAALEVDMALAFAGRPLRTQSRLIKLFAGAKYVGHSFK